ncbi:mercuric reductase [Flavobacterium oreochromis]|uniref:Mercuric reductase n=2 Tax=Flavobacterium TaxID=237 RepID=A0A246G853_9FLAO|nr:mercuric reductase [Flavobacterium oreochromis]OWP74945.1 mercuric reductase [Flavobacterium oreochromis]OWP75961.1 mercuric reductase [Flavobacterium oreochromis]
MKNYDYIIIGSGQAGTPLTFSLAKKGNVALIEKNKIGGTCLNYGCVPTKTYIASARRAWDAIHGEELGIEIPSGTITNLSKVNERKNKLINNSRNELEQAIQENPNITLYKGEAKFLTNYEIKVNGEIITAKNIFINVGGRALVPSEFQHIPHYTNIELLEEQKLPKHLIIIGGSYIGLEFGQMFKRFGSKVTIIERGSKLIGKEDEEISKAVEEILKADGIEFIFNANTINVEKNEDNSITVITKSDGTCVTGSHVLLAIGRLPNTDYLGLENTSIQVNNKGYINVNDYCQTNVEGIFALGDCNGRGAFTHTAYNDYQIVENFLLGNKTRKISDRITTYGLFIDPPLGRVGITKTEAQNKGYDILIAHRPMTKIGRAKEKGETFGFMEAIIDAKTQHFLGACVLGIGGDELINGFTNLMYAKQPYTVFRDGIHIHPTVSELIPTMLEKLVPL